MRIAGERTRRLNSDPYPNSPPAHDLTGLAVKFRALRWALIDDNTIIDDAARRQVLAFGT